MSINIQRASPTPISKSSFSKTTKTSKISEKKTTLQKNMKEFSEDTDFFNDFTPQQRNGRIIHQSTEHSYDDQGNKVTKTKIVREINDTSKKNKTEEIFSSPDFQPNSGYDSPQVFYNNRRQNSNLNNDNDIEEMGYKTNYVYESRKINGKSLGSYSTKEKYEYVNRKGTKESRYEKSVNGSPQITEIISPVQYVENSSGSELDENQMKSFDNFHYSIKTNNTNINTINNRRNNKFKLNYELEDPEGFDYLSKNERKVSNDDLKSSSRYINRSKIRNKYDDSSKSDIKDFQSPDKNIEKKNSTFRKVNMGMIESKGPSNDDNKVNNIITKEVIQTSSYKNRSNINKINNNNINTNKYTYNIHTQNYNNYYNNNAFYTEDEIMRMKAAKIIQYWWRSRFNKEQEEVYDITNSSAIRLQSFIRGFLVRKKVLRYITLAIYYQSFCDKLQDVLSSNVKKNIFELFKQLRLNAKPKIRIKKEDIYKRKRLLTKIIKKNNEYYYSYIINILRRWKNTANKIKMKSVTKNIKTTKMKEGYKTIKTTATSKTIFNTTNKSTMTYVDAKVTRDNKINKINKTNKVNNAINNSVKTTTIIKNVKNSNTNININNRNNKNILSTVKTITTPIKIKTMTVNSEQSSSYMDSRKYNKYNDSTYNYSNTKKEKERDSLARYSKRNTNIEYSSNIIKTNNLNKSFDAVYNNNYYETKKYNEYNNINYFNRVEKSNSKSKSKSKSKEDHRNISPKFGILRKTQTTTNTNILNTKPGKKTTIITVKNRSQLTKNNNINISTNLNKKETVSKNTSFRTSDINISKTLNETDYKSYTRDSKSPSKITTTTSTTKNNIRTNYFKTSEIINKKRKITKSEDIISRKEISYFPTNTIDNQLALSIIKLPNKNNDLNKTVELPQKVKIKEKIIIQKESKPETAEEGNNMQIFDMKISKRVSMFIEPDMELRKIIRDEQKELEIIKKREREKNKEIDKYKNDIENRKKKNKIDALKSSVLIVESLKKRILQKKLHEFKNYLFNQPQILEVQPTYDIQITQPPKQKRDFSVQITPKKEPKNFDVLQVANIRPISIEQRKIEKPHKITKMKFDIISKIPKTDQALQSDPWYNEIESMDDFNIIDPHRPRGEICVGETNEVQIQQDKPEMIDDEIQHEYEENFIEQESLEIPGTKKETIETPSQYDYLYKPKISKNNLKIIGIKKPEKKIITRDMETNTLINTVDEGLDALDLSEPKPKNIEVQIRTVKRSLYKMQIPILKKLWLRKAFRTFYENCQRPPYHLILLNELMRMYLLKWRFIKGYGPDRYGNAYDRDGNLLYRTKGRVADSEIQNEIYPEQDDQGTQYTPIENIISSLKQIEIGPAYKKEKKKITKEKSVGSDIRYDEKIIYGDSISIKNKKKKIENKISKSNFAIKKNEKILKNVETQVIPDENEVEKMDDFSVDNTEYIRKNKIKNFLSQIIFRRVISEKLLLSEALRNWLKYTLISVHDEDIENDYLRRMETAIKKNERFSLGENIQKQETGTQMILKKNKIESQLNLNLIQNIQKKNAEINVNIPYQFDMNKIKPKLQNKINIESTKKPVTLKRRQENTINIFSEDYIFQEEVKRGIHHQMSTESIKRVNEILYKFFISRGDPITLLRKYFTIWERKANYLTLLDNARIISEFCKTNLYRKLNYKKWSKICKKLILKEKIKIIKYSKILYSKLSKVFNLIRITRLNSIYSKRKYLHYIIIAWLAYTKTIRQKRSQVKLLYENMLSTYMNMADDVFGANQKENPSVQDALFEAVDSNKFQTKEIKDVPMALEYYENRKDKSKFNKSFMVICGEENKTNNKIYDDNNNKSNITISSNNNNISNNSYNNVITKNIFYKSINETKKNKGDTLKYEVKKGFRNVITNRFNNNNNNYNNLSRNSNTYDNISRNSSNLNKYNNTQEKVIIVKNEEKLKTKGRGRVFRTNSEKDIINNFSTNLKNYEKEKYSKNINDNEDFEENINNMSVKIEERKRNDEFDDYQEKKVDTIGKNRMTYAERRRLFRMKLFDDKK